MNGLGYTGNRYAAKVIPHLLTIERTPLRGYKHFVANCPLAWAMRLIEPSLDELDVHIQTPPSVPFYRWKKAA